MGSSATGYDNTNLVNGSSVFATLGSTVSSLSNFSNNTWGYSYCSDDCDTATNWVSGDSGSTTTGYAGLPLYTDTGVKLVNTTTTTDVDVKFKIGAKASMSQAAGTYTNTINFAAVAKVEPISYTISYIDNSGQSQDMPEADGPTSTTQDVEVTLSNVVPTRSDGYTFTGWCTASTSGNFCTGNYYQPGEKYPISNIGEDVNIELYAMWRGPLIYDLVAGMVKKIGNVPATQDATALRAVITTPTSSNPAEDTSNSGVYLYDGASSDVNDGYNIYYYRGILDSNLDGTTSTYGSNGDGVYYPNYVKLGNTCWRIVRTTASGGTKMIYNGLYSSGTTANSCANAQGNAQVVSRAFGMQGDSALSDWYRNINRVGYTFDNSSSIQDITDSTPVGTVFGDNSNYSTVNTENSNIKGYIENTWFSDALGSYQGALESSAGYCNDRSAYSDANGTHSLTDISPYATSGAAMYFGAYSRNLRSGKTLSLVCPRGTVDLYTTKNASDGNKQLKYPVALLTADEVALAGSGNGGLTAASNNSSNYSYSSYLRSGSSFWLLSPYYRYSNGNALGFYLDSGGRLSGGSVVNNGSGVRPAISLVHGTSISSGSGTATDPWVIYAQQ